MTKFYLFIILFSCGSAALAESYSCTHTLSNLKTPTQETKTTHSFNLTDFSKNCEKGPCEKQFLIEGETTGDTDNISLIVHNGKPPVIAAMIWNLKLGATKKFTEFGGLAGTNYKNRIYYQTLSGDTQHFVECEYQP